ncbi:DDE_3 domain-containing protein [Trichonephila clavipes]|nr:DDE_3 domain-containing protein [Trichonephila clavipes]
MTAIGRPICVIVSHVPLFASGYCLYEYLTTSTKPQNKGLRSHQRSCVPMTIQSRLSPPTVKHGGGSVMIWALMSWFSDGPILTLKGRIIGEKTTEILDQVHPMMRTWFPAGD